MGQLTPSRRIVDLWPAPVPSSLVPEEMRAMHLNQCILKCNILQWRWDSKSLSSSDKTIVGMTRMYVNAVSSFTIFNVRISIVAQLHMRFPDQMFNIWHIK